MVWLAFLSLALCSLCACAADAHLPQLAPNLAPNLAPQPAPELFVQASPLKVVPVIHVDPIPIAEPGTTVVLDPTPRVYATAGPQPAPLADPKEAVKKARVAEPTVAELIAVAHAETAASNPHNLSSTTQAPSSETSTQSILLATLIPFVGIVIIVPAVVLLTKRFATSRRAARFSREDFGHYLRTRV